MAEYISHIHRGVLFFLFFVLFSTVNPVHGAQPQQFVDDGGRKIEFAAPFTRIISLYPAHTENLAAMDATALLIGISREDQPAGLSGTVATFSYKDDPEKFIAAHPDLVLVRPMIERSYPEFIDKLRQAHITVISLQPNNIGEMLRYWRRLGQLTGKAPQAERLISRFNTEIAEIKTKVAAIPAEKRKKVYFEAIHSKIKTFAADSIAMYVLQQAGGINIAEDASQVRQTNIGFIGKERLLSHGEEIDVYLAQHGRMNPVSVELIENEPGFAAIRAVRDKNIYLIDEELVSRPTLRIVDGIRQVHSILYGERQ